MVPNVSALERAFELAATGHFSTVSEIKLKLLREGYQYEQVEGPLLSKQLVAAIAKARNSPPPKRTRPTHT
jgi:hypothetical protein